MAKTQGQVLAGLGVAGLFGIYADLAFNLYSATNSSPQTTELAANERAATLMKYVKIGDVGALGFGLMGSFMAGSLMPLFGAALVAGIMHLLYRHALKSGQGKARPSGIK